MGPRTDLAGYNDVLEGEYRKKILGLKPGLICKASLKYINEEMLLEKQENSLKYNAKLYSLIKLK